MHELKHLCVTQLKGRPWSYVFFILRGGREGRNYHRLLRAQPALISAMQNVETVFHFSALVAIPYSYLHPVEVLESNVMGALNFLLAGRETGVERIVHTSASEVYGTDIKAPIDETHFLQGQSPYLAGKIGADKLAGNFFCAYDLPVVTLLPFNTDGPR